MIIKLTNAKVVIFKYEQTITHLFETSEYNVQGQPLGIDTK